MRRILIAGSRGCDPRPLEIDEALKAFDPNIQPALEKFVVVTGGAKGADIAGARWATYRGHTNEIHEADWDQYGKQAGYIRNKEMVDSGIDIALIFWDGESKGTANTMKLVRAARIPHVIKIIYDDRA